MKAFRKKMRIISQDREVSITTQKIQVKTMGIKKVKDLM